MHILENKDLIVESKKAGAELVRIYSKNTIKKFFGMGMKNFGQEDLLYFFP